MSAPLHDYFRLAAAYVRINLKAQLEYRGAFICEALAMFVNDGVWVIFWMFFFRRFPVLHGWTLLDVLSLWAISTAGYGLAYAVMGNAHRQLATLISQGDLDLWLLQPRPVLPHLLLGRTIPTAWGDGLFGFVIYLAFVKPSFQQALMFAVLTIVVAVAFVGIGVLAGSLSFYLGNATMVADQWLNIVITFSTYPPTLFEGGMKVLLFTLIPSAFVSYVPVEALRSLSLPALLFAASGALALLLASIAVFYRGLRRYESGNLIGLRG